MEGKQERKGFCENDAQCNESSATSLTYLSYTTRASDSFCGRKDAGICHSGYFEQYGHIFYPDAGGSSYDSPPPPPDSYGSGASSAAAPFYAPPPPPLFGSSSFGLASSSMMTLLHGTQAATHGLSAGELSATRLSDALFAPHIGMSSSISSLSNPSLDISPNSLEATTLPENAYLVSNL